jgi:FkbM family methyltransferase
MAHLKRAIRAALERRGVSYTFNDTAVYRMYLRLMYPQAARVRQQHAAFFRRLLNGAELVFDIGASNGDKAFIFSRCADRIICLEPNPECAARLARRFRHDRMITIVPEGVSDSAGVGTISVYSGDESALSSFSQRWIEEHGAPARTVEVKLTTLEDLISRFGRPSYIKIDVEGFEVNVLRGLRSSVPLVSFECNLPMFLSETLECITLLDRLADNCRFNFCISEPPLDFAMDMWVSAEEMRAIAVKRNLRYMEVFCRSASTPEL